MYSAKASYSPVEDRLRRLMTRGFQFLYTRDGDGQVTAVIGVLAHHTVIDVARLCAPDDVVATRMPGGEPDILSPRKVLWRRAGEADVVLDELLSLPDDDASPGRKPVRGCWVPSGGSQVKWLAAPRREPGEGETQRGVWRMERAKRHVGPRHLHVATYT
jgi:hypothetical protein